MTMITKLEQLFVATRDLERKTLVVAHAEDPHTLEAVNRAVDFGIVDAILIGEQQEIVRILEAESIYPDKFTIIDQKGDIECVNMAVKMVRNGEADFMMKGLVSTDKYMRGILNKEFGLLPPKGVLSHIAVVELPMYHKLVLVSDVAVIPNPDINQKVAIIKYMTKIANELGIDKPNIAVIAPSEQMLPNISSSVDAAILSKMGDRGQLGNINIDGPLAVDVALMKEIAQTKRLNSSIAGDVDCMLFPNLDAANSFFKSATQLCKAPLAGIVTGTIKPCILTSRGDTADSKLYSIALAALCSK